MPALPNYDEWNSAMHRYFLSGVPAGSTVYLEVSEASLERIGGRNFGEEPEVGWTEAFLSAVRERLVTSEGVQLNRLRQLGSRNRLDALPFLGVLVLVANRMESDEKTHERDYFTRLNAALGTVAANKQVRRPAGMQVGSEAEEPLWQQWGTMLKRMGLLPTAHSGEGAWRYIRYAVSQTLFRATDRNRLNNLFAEYAWTEDTDPEMMVAQLRSRSGALPRHIFNLLQRSGADADDVTHALHEVFLDWLDNKHACAGGSKGSGKLRRSILAGLRRTRHFRTGQVRYEIYPKQPRGMKDDAIRVAFGDQSHPLMLDRPGFFLPLPVAVTAEMLRDGIKAPLEGSQELEQLVLPSQQIWVMKQDPFDSAVFASLGRPGVGEHFTLLIHTDLRNDLEKAIEQGLIKHSGQGHVDALGGDWIEYRDVMVVANQFGEAGDISPHLRAAIQPAGVLALTTRGGLPVPRLSGWLVDAPPEVHVSSYFPELQFKVSLDGYDLVDELLYADPAAPEVVPIPWQGAGAYEITVGSVAQGQAQRLLINLLAWDNLPPAPETELGLEVSRVSPGVVLTGSTLSAVEA